MTRAPLAMHEIVAIAAFLVGGAHKKVDTEDVAIKANEIAPGRFTWRKYKEQIDLELVYKHLWDLTKPEKGAYVTGSKTNGWMTTLAGTSFAERSLDKLSRLPIKQEKLSRNEELWQRRERGRMVAEPAFQKLAGGRPQDVSFAEAERFFRLDDYVVGAARDRKLQHAENAFRNDPELGPVVLAAAAIIRGKHD